MYYANVHVIATPIATSTTSARGALTPSSSSYFAVVNDSDAIAYVNAGDVTVVATSANPAVAPNSSQVFQRKVDSDTYVAVLLSAGTGFASVYPCTLLGN